MAELTKQQRLRRLLQAGLFPEELPPPFNSEDFCRYRSFLWRSWSAIQTLRIENYSSIAERVSVPRFGRARREASIVNPVNYLLIAKEIADKWIEIRKFIKRSDISVFRPIFDRYGRRSFFAIDFREVEDRKHDILSSYKGYIKTDVSRYYPTVYTHSIAWALHGKAYCKQNKNTAAYKATLGARLDKFVRNSQDGQSIGIPIGPDTSRVLGEIVATGIDMHLQNRSVVKDRNAFRYVDDLYVSYDADDAPDAIFNQIASGFSEFELEMNMEKTQFVDDASADGPDWRIELLNHSINRIRAPRQRDGIAAYFKKAYHFGELDKSDNVLAYAVKRARSFRILPENWAYFESYLLRVGRNNWTTIPAIVQILIDGKAQGFAITENKVGKFINDTLRRVLPISATVEICWLLFLAKGLRARIHQENVQVISKIESSAVALLTLDLNSRGQLDGPLDLSSWEDTMKADGLRGHMWLLMYEGSLKGWLPVVWKTAVQSDSYFSKLLAKHVSFYDMKKNVPRIRADLRRMFREFSRRRYVFSHLTQYE